MTHNRNLMNFRDTCCPELNLEDVEVFYKLLYTLQKLRKKETKFA